jgi:NAD(P)-dependent dehydrogenase (short-subunit alcohol dehydrogenase family)
VQLPGRVALVTGAGAGIGRAVALALARENAVVVAADVDAAAGAETVATIESAGGRALFFQADVSAAADVRAMVDFTLAELGGLDVLVNNAGGAGTPFPAATAEEWQRTLDVNLRGLMLATQLAFAAMGGEGAIVNISSVAGLGTTAYGSPEYAAAKAAVVRLSAALAKRDGVRVNCVCPDWVDTPAVQRSLAAMTPDDRAQVPPLVPAEEIAAIVLDLVRDDSLAGRIVARFADEPGPRLLPADRRD